MANATTETKLEPLDFIAPRDARIERTDPLSASEPWPTVRMPKGARVTFRAASSSPYVGAWSLQPGGFCVIASDVPRVHAELVALRDSVAVQDFGGKSANWWGVPSTELESVIAEANEATERMRCSLPPGATITFKATPLHQAIPLEVYGLKVVSDSLIPRGAMNFRMNGYQFLHPADYAELKAELDKRATVPVVESKPVEGRLPPGVVVDMIDPIIAEQVARGGVDTEGTRAQAERWCAMLAECVCEGMRATTDASALRARPSDVVWWETRWRGIPLGRP